MYSGVLSICRKLLTFVLPVGVLLACALTTTSHAAPGINQAINFQGRLLNAQGATVPDGYYNVQFKIYQDGDGQTAGNTTGSPAGSLKWTETHLNANTQGVQVKNGFMSVELGSVTAFGSSVDWNQDTLWLSMNIGNTNASCSPFANCSPDGEMTPMKRLSATPFSLNSNLLGGLASSQFVQFAQGVQTDALTNSNSIFINKTSTGNFLALQSAGTDVFLLNNSGDVTFGGNANHSISVAAAPSGVTGKTLTVSAGSAANIGTGAGGGDLVLQGGNAAGSGNNNGGNIYLSGGTATGTGTKGLVNLGASAYTASTNSGCGADCTINQANVDNFGTVIVSASTTNIVMTLPDPTNVATAGRIIYITTANGSQDYILTTNTGASVINVAMRQNTTATMIWNGTDWTPGGASNATTLQATYNNGTNPTTTPEIKLDSTRSTIDIQDADTTIGSDILNIRSSNAAGLGTVLFGVSNTGRVTIQGTSDEYSAFRVLNATGDYQFNINSSNGYVISNSIKTPGNDIVNPSFETGGSTIGGEEGWFGPVQSSIVSSNANTGNNSLQVTANTADMDVYAGTYFEVKPGDSLYLQGYVKNSAGANGTAGIQIKWYDKDKQLLSASTDYASLPGTSYVLRKVSATAPAGAVYARISATVRASATTGTFYFDDFYMKKNVESADYTFRNSIDSTAAFRIQSAQSADTLLTANTTDNILKVGDSTGSDTQTTLLVLDNTTTNPSTSLGSKNGGLFYRSDTNSLKAVIGGAVVDICTTAVTCSGYSASASSSIQLQGSTPGTAQVGHFNITGTGILTQLQTQDQSAASTNSSNLVIRTGNATGSSSNSGDLILDVGSATGTAGSITIGHSGVTTTMGGTLSIQGNNALALGQASTTTGSILFNTAAGVNTVTLKAPGANPAASFNLTLPQNLGSAGDCLKDSGSGVLTFGNCSAGSTTNLQDVYNNSSSPATVTLADGKSLQVVAQDTTTDPNILFNLQCANSCGSNGRFAIQNNGTDIFTVNPNGGGMVLNGPVQIGSSTTDSTQTNLQLDSYNGSNDSGTCTTTSSQGAMYYNSTMGTIRACINGNWSDISNPEPLGLLSFGVVPASGSQPYDLPALTTTGASGPCKVSYSNATTIAWQACTAYSGGQRISVAAGSVALGTTAFSQWRHLCLTGANGQPALSAASTSATANMPSFSVSAPVLCLADIKSAASGSVGNIGQIYDTRTFTSSLKEAVPASTAVELGMIADASGTNGAMVPASASSQKLYGLVVATNGSTSTTTPNTIVTTIGPGWIKAAAGTAGQFVKSSTTSGYADTIAAIPNNSFYYSAGNTRTSFANTCTAANNCNGSLYVNFIVR
jgi:hypothetical protein